MSGAAGEELGVHLYGERVGGLERRGPRRYRFRYDEDARSRYGDGTIVISASLPVQEAEFSPSATRPFFDGLLPEGAVRSRLAQSLRVSEEDGFALLAALGAECAGAAYPRRWIATKEDAALQGAHSRSCQSQITSTS